jgi:hypothetical protein
MVKLGSFMIINSQFSSANEIKNGIWILGVSCSFFGAINLLIESLSDSYMSYAELFCFLVAALLLMVCVALKPEIGEEFNMAKRLERSSLNSSLSYDEEYLLAAKIRMLELKKHHVISQLHVLPFPYLSQIYHLLNLKHLETVHANTLGSLKVLDVYNCHQTPSGGSIQFKTALNSPLNILKIWRKSTVSVELILHTPYMIELTIPVYGGSQMIVLFNVFPLGKSAHEFSVDIYTDLPYPKFLLRAILHLASIFTLYEDLPYLKKLSRKETDGLLALKKVSNHKSMWLFKRFVHLHGSKAQLPKAA